MTRVLIVGAARGGSTWAGRTLGAAGGCYVHEPDDPPSEQLARVGNSLTGWIPGRLAPDDHVPLYQAMWDVAFNGGWPEDRITRLSRRWLPGLPGFARRPIYSLLVRRAMRRPAPEHVVVKTVRGRLSCDWLAWRYRPEVIVMVAHPLNVISSWLSVGWSGQTQAGHSTLRDAVAAMGLPAPRDIGGGVETAAWAVCSSAAILAAAAEAHPEWQYAVHEELCVEPMSGFERLARGAGLPWTQASIDYLQGTDRPGRADDHYGVTRVTVDQLERWRRLSDADLAAAVGVVREFAERSQPFSALLERVGQTAVGAGEAVAS